MFWSYRETSKKDIRNSYYRSSTASIIETKSVNTGPDPTALFTAIISENNPAPRQTNTKYVRFEAFS